MVVSKTPLTHTHKSAEAAGQSLQEPPKLGYGGHGPVGIQRKYICVYSSHSIKLIACLQSVRRADKQTEGA